jgi:2-polyprenyl-3-methyl-5-hydroxy-6-metoxy-1,4-benzoquinol methylase
MPSDLDQSREFYQDFFAEQTERSYDNQQRYRIVYSLINELPLTSKANVLDVGAGSGRITQYLDGMFDSVISLDIIIAPLLQETVDDRDLHAIEGALPNLPFQDNQFDLVVCSEVLEHIPKRSSQISAIQELNRITVNGGYVVISTPNPRSPFYRGKKLIRGVGRLLGVAKGNDYGGQHVENWFPPSQLHNAITSEFTLIKRRGSYYVLPDFGTGLKRHLHPISDKITDLNLAPSLGLYQYYVGQA